MTQPAAWNSSTAYNLGAVVRPFTDPGTGFYFRCVVAGVSGTFEPFWPTIIDNTVQDGTVTWAAVSIVAGDFQQPDPSAIIELFELQLFNDIHGTTDLYRFHAGTSLVNEGRLVWRGNSYERWPVEADGFEYNGQGQLPRPKVRVSNILGSITGLLLSVPNGLEGAKMTRIRTLAKYIDAVNFPGIPRRNLLIWSQELNRNLAGQWLRIGSTISANVTLAPDASNTADKVVETAAFDNHGIQQSITKTAQAQAYTGSIHVKAAERGFLLLVLYGTSEVNRALAIVNIASGISTAVRAEGAFTNAACTITTLTNGWIRVELSCVSNTDTNMTMRALMRPTSVEGSTSAYTGDGVSGMFMWGAQLEQSAVATEYQRIDGTYDSAGTNPFGTPDPSAQFPQEVFYIDRKTAENREVVEFEMVSAMDLAGVRAPKRQCIGNICQWRYRSTECGYNGTGYWDANDQPVGSIAQDVCGKRLDSCRLRFGQNAELPFGSFPGVGQVN